ncbi:hypothetical protein L1047_15410 [Synechococcus sp. Nb3U1]|uniref:hypothetical protein n=1 Tax=Synechococcus sp. Nb3U1 TaxID=1914529 RepID=UPI001F40C195|nr:hypothetical protein [Synechococcus sp. Nb3U1]MCF2972582.1 hypothetical protein [Synechococcus sp. Nb3U1]
MKNANFRLLLVAALLMVLSLASSARAQPRQRTRITTTQPAGSLNISGERTSTGPGSFSHSGSYTRTGSNGGSGSGTYSGQGSRQFIPGQGVEGEYAGQITTEQGQNWHINHQHTTIRTDEGWQRQGNTTVQNAAGETVGSSSAIIKGQPGEGWQRTGQLHNARGQSLTTESSGTPTGPGQRRLKTRVFNGEGELLGGSDTDVQYQFVPGQGWVKTVEGNTLNGQPIRRTTTASPSL